MSTNQMLYILGLCLGVICISVSIIYFIVFKRKLNAIIKSNSNFSLINQNQKDVKNVVFKHFSGWFMALLLTLGICIFLFCIAMLAGGNI